MNRAHPFRNASIILPIIVLFFSGCAGTVKPTSPDDTPKIHYEAGIKLLDDKDPLKPEAEFTRAVALDKRSPYGYAGRAALALNRKQFPQALKDAGRAVRCDSTFADAFFTMGRAYMELRKRGWFENAESSFKRLLVVEPEGGRALFSLGGACLAAYRFEEARSYFEKVAAGKNTYTDRAALGKTLCDRIIQAKPLTDAGKRVCLAETASRSDVCRLLDDELGLRELVKRHRLMRYEAMYRGDEGLRHIPPDIDEHTDRKAVIDVLVLRLDHLNVYPNGYFHPERPVTRAELSMTLQEISAFLMEDQTLPTRYSTAGSPFADVRPDYYAFNAIMLGVERGYLTYNVTSGLFNPEATMSGVDVLLSLRSFGDLFAVR